ncbi:hypothetical protein ACSBR2_009422 [Camellia fascicularis]
MFSFFELSIAVSLRFLRVLTSISHYPNRFHLLLKRELANEKIENPEICHGQASQSKKGEDFTFVKTECQRVVGDEVFTYSVFALFDGHNGPAAAIYSKENLLNNVLACIPSDLNRDEWIWLRAQTSGTTVTFMIIEGWFITVASVGDSCCVFESADGEIYYLSADHRLECSVQEYFPCRSVLLVECMSVKNVANFCFCYLRRMMKKTFNFGLCSFEL